MKQITLILFYLLSFYVGTAKDKELKIKKAERVELVKMLSAGTSVSSMQYDLPYDIFSWKYDAVRREIIVLLKDNGMSMNRGYLAVYNLATESFRWEMPVNVFDVFTSGNYILLTTAAATICYSRVNGDTLWQAENFRIRHVDTVSQVGISSLGKGLDLNTGKIIWERKLKKSDYWTDYTVLNDSMVACISDGLHVINTRTGNGIIVEGKTEKYDHRGAIALGVGAGIFGGVIGVVIMSSFSGDGKIIGMNSQMLADGNKLYFAMLDRICCVDFVRGRVSWISPLPKSFSSRSYLYMLDGKIVLVNDGLVDQPSGSATLMGTPYICVYDKNNGFAAFEDYLKPKYGSLHDRKLHGDTLIFIHSSSICKLNITNGREYIHKKNLEATTFYESFVNKNSVYLGSPENRMARLDKVYPDISELILDNKKMLVVLDGNYEQVGKLNSKELGFTVAGEGAFSIVHKDRKRYILKNDTPFVQLNDKGNGIIIEGKYYHFAEDKMIIIDLESLR